MHQNIYHLKWAISKNNCSIDWSWLWPCFCDQVLSLVPRIVCIIVYWEKPPIGWVKVNTYESRNLEGMCGTGGIIRDSERRLILAFTQAVGIGSSN